MAGSHIHRLRGGPFAAALALFLLTFDGPALAQDPSPPVPAAGIPAPDLSLFSIRNYHAGSERRDR